MTLRDQILACPDLVPAIEARDCEAIAVAMSVGRVRQEKRLIGIGTVLDALGPAEGAAVLDAIQALVPLSSPVKYGWMLLEKDNLDVSLPSVRGQFDQLAQSGVMTQAQAGTLKALADVPESVTPQQVAAALYNDDGSLK